ncbi:hypothetical protein, partial [Sphingomonas quercus]
MSTTLIAVAPAAWAQTSIAPASELSTAAGTTTPAADAAWLLTGDGIWLSQAVSLPQGAPGLTIDGDGHVLTMNDGAGVAGRFTIASGSSASLNLANITLTGANQPSAATSGYGGAISHLGFEVGSLAIAMTGDVTLSGNHSEHIGGAIRSSGALTITGERISFIGNSATSAAGAISAGDVSIGNAGSIVTFSGNISGHLASGGAIAGAHVTIDGASITFAGNISGTTDSQEFSGTGGAIDSTGYTIGGAGTGAVTITGNIARTNSGGALHATTTSSSITGDVVTISDNHAGDDNQPGGHGGALWQGLGAALTIHGGEISISDNSAHGQGGAIFGRDAVTVGDADSIVTLTDNGSLTGGGAIMNYINVAQGQLTTTTINGGDITISGNHAEYNSGGAIDTDGDVIIGRADSIVAIRNNNVLNAAGVTDANGELYGGWGGAVYGINVAINGADVSLTGNGAATSGGAVYAETGVSIGEDGGAVTITGNTAAYGGAIYSEGAVAITGANITLSGNDTTGARTTALRKARVTIEGDERAVTGVAGAGALARILDSTSGHGGAIYAEGPVTIGDAGSRVTIDGNSGSMGGAVIGFDTVTINGGEIRLTDNSASDVGGAVAAVGTLLIGGAGSTVSMTGNSAANYGGAIYAEKAVTITGSDVAIAGNEAPTTSAPSPGGRAPILRESPRPDTGGHGGAIYAGEDVLITGGNAMLAGNAGAARGGAIYGLGAVTIGEAGGVTSLSGNSAGWDGGAIFAGGPVTIRGSEIIISGNSAADGLGGGILVTNGDAIIGGPDSVVTLADNNAATLGTASFGYGGAVWLQDGGIVVDGASITVSGNIAENGGGALDTRAGTIRVGNATSEVSFAGNAAEGTSGGAINAYGGDLVIDGARIAFTDNHAGIVGGAIGAAGNATIGNAASAVSFARNVVGSIGEGTLATNGGGAISQDGAGNVMTINGRTIDFVDNNAFLLGGAIASEGSIVLGGAGSTISFTGNSAGGADGTGPGDGGAIFSGVSTTLTGALTISNNRSGTSGGAIVSDGDITLNVTGDSLISGNRAGGPAARAAGPAVDEALAERAAGLVTRAATRAPLTASGGAIWAAGNVTLNATGGTVSFTGNMVGARANAIWLENLSGDATLAFDTTATGAISFLDPIASNQASGPVTVTASGAGAVMFDGASQSAAVDRWSRIYGVTEVRGGTFAVRDDAVYGMLAADAGAVEPTAFTVFAGGTLAGGSVGEVRADRFSLAGTLDIAGRGLPAAATSGFSRFVITSGTNAFVPGSQILFNTMLNADDSRTDLLSLNGGIATGRATILVNPAGGSGALTTRDGIRLVLAESGATTAIDTFSLGGRVIAGPYEYHLYRGGSAASTANDWFLRSTLDCTLDPLVEICADVPAPPEPPSPPEAEAPEPPQPPLPLVPEYRAEASLYAAMPAMQLLYGATLLDTLHERVGDEGGGVARAGGGTGPSQIWGRLILQAGTQGDLSRGIYRDGPRFNYDMLAVQIGIDLYRGSRDHAGVYGAWGRMNANVRHFDASAAGKDRLKGWTAGGYWTRFWDNGWYSDVVAQYGWNRLRANAAGPATMDTLLRRIGVRSARLAPDAQAGVDGRASTRG